MTKRFFLQHDKDPRKRVLSRFILLSLIFVFSALACDLSDVTALLGGGGKPTVVINSPPSGSQYQEGQDVAVQSISTDSKGILQVDLIVDGQVVRSDRAPVPQDQFTLIQPWKATQGSHTILVRAYNTQNAVSDPAAISIQVTAGAGPSSTAVAGGPATPTSSPSPTTAPVIPSITTAPSGCTNNSAFVTDVSIPDGTTINAGQTFLKSWRLSNNGTCTWGAGYQFVFISGEAMSSSTVIAVPSTAPGATVDLQVPMTAPAGAGSHTGSWRLRTPGGVLFGATVSVKITVPGAPPPVPTATSVPPVPAGCSGAPSISSFGASVTTITAGGSTTLNWGLVTNADSVEIDQGIGGIATPGSTGVSPGATTTYTLTAHCGGTAATRQVTITVNPASLTAPLQIAPANGTVLHTFPRVTTFQWSPVSGPGTITYNIEIQIDTGSMIPFRTETGISGTSYTNTAHPFSGDNPGRWRVWATSSTIGDGLKSGWFTMSWSTGP